MRRPIAFFPIVLALAAMILAPRVGAQAQESREEGPFEIKKCQTISKPGSYKLVKNLNFTTGPGGSCLEITADFVTIDLAGFTINGGRFNPGVAIQGAAPSGGSRLGIAVRNGSIVGFQNGVNLFGAEGSIVEGLRISQISFDGILATGS